MKRIELFGNWFGGAKVRMSRRDCVAAIHRILYSNFEHEASDKMIASTKSWSDQKVNETLLKIKNLLANE